MDANFVRLLTTSVDADKSSYRHQAGKTLILKKKRVLMSDDKTFSLGDNHVSIDDDGSVSILHQAGSSMTILPDGSSKVDHVSGATIRTAADGTVALEMPVVKKVGILNVMNIVSFKRTVDSEQTHLRVDFEDGAFLEIAYGHDAGLRKLHTSGVKMSLSPEPGVIDFDFDGQASPITKQ